jgi:hypothetical protein
MLGVDRFDPDPNDRKKSTVHQPANSRYDPWKCGTYPVSHNRLTGLIMFIDPYTKLH